MHRIREKISPHFGNLETFERWAKQSSVHNVLEIIDWIKLHKSISKIELKKYNYYSFLVFMVECERNHKLEMIFKTEFSGDRKKWFYETFEELKNDYIIISENKQKFLSLKKNASKPKSIEEFKKYIVAVSRFNEYTELLDSDNYQKFGDNDEYILIELNDENCSRLSPPCWCITDINTFRQYRQNQKIYLLINQMVDDSERFIGVNYDENNKFVSSYQNALNSLTYIYSDLETTLLELIRIPEKDKPIADNIKNIFGGRLGRICKKLFYKAIFLFYEPV